ncbi:MAG: hypothetical protein AAGF12_25875 [Myxococcota bacterium]
MVATHTPNAQWSLTLVAWLVSGCSLVIDSGQYVGTRDAGTQPDGRVDMDAAPDRVLPTECQFAIDEGCCDFDGDQFLDPDAPAPCPGRRDVLDCDPMNPNNFPGAPGVCGDGIENGCGVGPLAELTDELGVAEFGATPLLALGIGMLPMADVGVEGTRGQFFGMESGVLRITAYEIGATVVERGQIDTPPQEQLVAFSADSLFDDRVALAAYYNPGGVHRLWEVNGPGGVDDLGEWAGDGSRIVPGPAVGLNLVASGLRPAAFWRAQMPPRVSYGTAGEINPADGLGVGHTEVPGGLRASGRAILVRQRASESDNYVLAQVGGDAESVTLPSSVPMARADVASNGASLVVAVSTDTSVELYRCGVDDIAQCGTLNEVIENGSFPRVVEAAIDFGGADEFLALNRGSRIDLVVQRDGPTPQLIEIEDLFDFGGDQIRSLEISAAGTAGRYHFAIAFAVQEDGAGPFESFGQGFFSCDDL